MTGWRDYAGGDFAFHQGPGDHDAPYDVFGELFAAIVHRGLSGR